MDGDIMEGNAGRNGRTFGSVAFNVVRRDARRKSL